MLEGTIFDNFWAQKSRFLDLFFVVLKLFRKYLGALKNNTFHFNTYFLLCLQFSNIEKEQTTQRITYVGRN